MPGFESLPDRADELSQKHYGQTLDMFILHGNVRDLAADPYQPAERL